MRFDDVDADCMCLPIGRAEVTHFSLCIQALRSMVETYSDLAAKLSEFVEIEVTFESAHEAFQRDLCAIDPESIIGLY
jgi:hypothetical protein